MTGPTSTELTDGRTRGQPRPHEGGDEDERGARRAQQSSSSSSSGGGQASAAAAAAERGDDTGTQPQPSDEEHYTYTGKAQRAHQAMTAPQTPQHRLEAEMLWEVDRVRELEKITTTVIRETIRVIGTTATRQLHTCVWDGVEILSTEFETEEVDVMYAMKCVLCSTGGYKTAGRAPRGGEAWRLAKTRQVHHRRR